MLKILFFVTNYTKYSRINFCKFVQFAANIIIKIRFKPIILYKDSRFNDYKLREIYFTAAIYENENI
ncbi:hypothetical protein AR687_13160 [Flavobacteriaceae bacterium CRH]|nr:hypothetical protein AR687_13160 [Flavobacteriaceae bacterium CRH]